MMNSHKVDSAMKADAHRGRNEPWKRHVRVLQEYVGELIEALREYEAESKAHIVDSGSGNQTKDETEVRRKYIVNSAIREAVSRAHSRVRETDFGNTDEAISDEYDEVINETTKSAIDAADRGEVDRTLPVSLIWEAVFNPPEGMEDYQAYRIEYGGHAMACVMEGSIWLPPGVDPQTIERILQGGDL